MTIKTKSFAKQFSSNYQNEYLLLVTVKLFGDGAKDLEDILDFTDDKIIEELSLQVVNLQDHKVYNYSFDRIKQSFNYMLGNVKNGVLEYFDWEPIHLLVIEEIID